MKNTIFRLFALVLILVLLLAAFSACKTPDGTENSGGNSTVIDPIQIKTTIYEIAKHGNLVLYMYGKDLYDKGFAHGDVVEIAIGEKTWEAPLCTSYSDVDNGEVVLRANGDADGVVLAINMGDFATTAKIAQKTAIDEDPGYRWDYLMESPVEITITMKEKGGYREAWLIRQLARTNERADYAHLSDEAFANFRVIETTGMGKGLLYRSSSPINPALGRNTYADEAAKNAGIVTVVNLADPSNTYEGTENSYYSTAQVVYVNLGMDFLSESTLRGIAEGMRFIIQNDGPYLIHCNEGKDRAGFVSTLLECLMGATIDEAIDDYMLTYYNYYGVEKGSEKYNAIVKNNLIKVLNATFKVEDVYKADLVSEAEAFLIEDAGLTAEEVAVLKGKLRISLQEIYDLSSVGSLLENHESVHVVRTYNGVVGSEEYYNREYSYLFYAGEAYGTESDEAYLITDHSYYMLSGGSILRLVPLTPDGMANMKDIFADEKSNVNVFSADLINDIITSVTEQDGHIIVKSIADQEEIASTEGLISCEEELVLDAKTRALISIKSIYTYEDGAHEGKTEFIYDTEAPEGVKAFLECDAQTTDMRTVTVVTNPGAENERTESIQAPRGMIVGLAPEFEYYDRSFTIYADEGCTQVFGSPDVNSDITVYIKWDE